MPGERLEHVVEESDSAANARVAAPVERHAHAENRFLSSYDGLPQFVT
jgi:hypothetical protein